MQYDIRLRIDYAYHAPSDHARTLLRLLPLDSADQTVLTRTLRVGPAPSEQDSGQDFFGNPITMLVWHDPVDHISLEVVGRIDRHAQMPGADLSVLLDALPGAMAGQGIGPRAPVHYLAHSPRVPPDDDVARFVRRAVPPAATVFAAVEAAGRALHAAMTFDPEATDVHTLPGQAFAARRGVCQDYAHILIGGMRALGVPTAYVSGLLRTTPPPGQPRLDGVDAMHAWVSVWGGADAGWRDYDPTNACWVGDDHLVIARGRDYADVAPVKGALRSAGGQDSRQAVDVVPVAQLRRGAGG